MLMDKEERRKRKAERKEKEMIRLALLAAGDHDSDEEKDDEDDDDEVEEMEITGEKEEKEEKEDVKEQKGDEGEEEKEKIENIAEEEKVVDTFTHQDSQKESSRKAKSVTFFDERNDLAADDKVDSSWRRQHNEKDDDSAMDISTLSVDSGSYLDTLPDKKMTVYDLNDELANVASGVETNPKYQSSFGANGRSSSQENVRGPAGPNPRSSSEITSRGPAGLNPRAGPDVDKNGKNEKEYSRGPPGPNPRDISTSQLFSGSHYGDHKASDSDDEMQVKRNSDLCVNSLEITDISDKLKLSGEAFIVIHVLNGEGVTVQELETDSQKLIGESLYWRFDSGSSIEESHPGSVLVVRNALKGAVSSLNFQLVTVQDGKREIQAEFATDCSNINEKLSSKSKGSNQGEVNITGKMCRSDIVNICSISVLMNTCL